MLDPHLPVISQEIGKPDPFIAQRGKNQNIFPLDIRGAIYNTREFAALAECLKLALAPFSSQLDLCPETQ
jgi:hypothetical protein